MLVGILIVGVWTLLGLFLSFQSAARETLLLHAPRLTRLDDAALATDDEMCRFSEELLALGFAREGTWDFVSRVFSDPERRRNQVLLSAFLSPDRRVEALVTRIRILRAAGSRKAAGATGSCSFQSLAADGRVVVTSSSGALSPLPVPPNHIVQRLRGASVTDLYAAHQTWLREQGFEAIALRPEDYVARETQGNLDILEHWHARGLIRREQDGYRKTARFALRSFVFYGLYPIGFERDPLVAPLVYGLLIAVAVAASAWTATLRGQAALVSAIVVFASLTMACNLLMRRSALSWAYACVPCALVFHAAGVTSVLPWLAGVLVFILATHVLGGANYRREEAQFQAARAASKPPSSPGPPTSS